MGFEALEFGDFTMRLTGPSGRVSRHMADVQHATYFIFPLPSFYNSTNDPSRTYRLRVSEITETVLLTLLSMFVPLVWH